MTTRAELMLKLRAAHDAGDTVAATRFAAMARAAPEKGYDVSGTQWIDNLKTGGNGIDRAVAAFGQALEQQTANAGDWIREAVAPAPTTSDQVAPKPRHGAGISAVLPYLGLGHAQSPTETQALADMNPTANLLGHVGAGYVTGAGVGGALMKLGAGTGVVGALGNILGNAGVAAATADSNDRYGAGILSAGLESLTRGGARILRGAAPATEAALEQITQGVTPTIGQATRQAGRGGSAINTVEEAMRSLPILGGIISGAREEASGNAIQNLFRRAVTRAPLDGDTIASNPYPTKVLEKAKKTIGKQYDRAIAGPANADMIRQALTTHAAGVTRDTPEMQKFVRDLSYMDQRLPPAGPQGSTITGQEAKRIGSDARINADVARAPGPGAMAPDHTDIAAAYDDIQRTIENSYSGSPLRIKAVKSKFANLAVFEDAAKRASTLKSEGVITPGQLLAAYRDAGYLPMRETAQKIANVFADRLPDSGTATRTAVVARAGAALGLGGAASAGGGMLLGGNTPGLDWGTTGILGAGATAPLAAIGLAALMPAGARRAMLGATRPQRAVNSAILRAPSIYNGVMSGSTRGMVEDRMDSIEDQ